MSFRVLTVSPGDGPARRVGRTALTDIRSRRPAHASQEVAAPLPPQPLPDPEPLLPPKLNLGSEDVEPRGDGFEVRLRGVTVRVWGS